MPTSTASPSQWIVIARDGALKCSISGYGPFGTYEAAKRLVRDQHLEGAFISKLFSRDEPARTVEVRG
jgi:hypothetical protein